MSKSELIHLGATILLGVAVLFLSIVNSRQGWEIQQLRELVLGHQSVLAKHQELHDHALELHQSYLRGATRR